MTNDLAKLLKEIGKSTDFLTMASSVPEVRKVSSGLLEVDTLLGGGWPLSRQVTLYGRPGSAKSTLALYTVAEAQRQGMTCLVIDTEGSFDNDWATKLGVDTDNLVLIQRKALEHIVEALNAAKDKGLEFDVIVVDSISDVESMAVLDADSNGIATQAKATKRLMFKLGYLYPQALRLLVSQLTVKFSSQHVENVPTGGNALIHESSYMLYLNFGKSDQKKGTVTIGDRVVNREIASVNITWEFRKARSDVWGLRGTFRFIPARGIDRVDELISTGILTGVIEASGKWFSFRTIKNADGRDKFLEELYNDLDLMEELRNEILARAKSGPAAAGGEEGAGSRAEIDSV